VAVGVVDADGAGVANTDAEGLVVGEGAALGAMVAVAPDVEVGVGVGVGCSVEVAADAQAMSRSAAVSPAKVLISAETVSVSLGFRSEF
jgi:hypothetical protein